MSSNTHNKFLFVDGLRSHGRGEARVHLSKEQHRKRRKLSHIRDDLITSRTKRIIGCDELRALPSPYDLGSSRCDPFISHSPLFKADDEALLHHCIANPKYNSWNLIWYADTIVIPSIFRTHWRHAGNIVPAVDLFHLYRQFPQSLNAVLLEAASHRAQLYDLPYPFSYENRVIRSILQDIHAPNHGTMLATSIIANIHRRDSNANSLHWQALQHIIQLCGGLYSLRSNTLLFTKIAWTLIALSNTSNGFIDHTLDSRGFRELETLLKSRGLAMLKTLPTSQNDEDQQSACVRYFAFQALNPLGKLLRPQYRRLVAIGESNGLPSAEDSCRVAVIMFLNAAIQYHGEASVATKAYIDRLQKYLQEGADDAYLSCAHLLYAMLRLSFLNQLSEKCLEIWTSVVRMMAAWKRLQLESQQKAESILMASLLNTEENSSESIWDGAASTVPSAERSSARSIPPKDTYCELLWFTLPVGA